MIASDPPCGDKKLKAKTTFSSGFLVAGVKGRQVPPVGKRTSKQKITFSGGFFVAGGKGRRFHLQG
jgi:hypothetical protein